MERSKEDDHYAEYIKQHLGNCLTSAIAEIVQIRPKDPIEYLAHLLYTNKGMNPQGRKAEASRMGSSASGASGDIGTASTSRGPHNPGTSSASPAQRPTHQDKAKVATKPNRSQDIVVQIVHRNNEEDDFIDEDFGNISTYNATMTHVHTEFNKISIDLFDNDDIW